MRKNFGPKTWMYPMPVLIIATYDAEGNPDAMNAAWGGICEYNQVMLSLSEEHRTTKNIREKGAFTVSFADAAHVTEADYVGLVSANKVPDKLARAGLHTTRSAFVDAPLIDEFPMTLECRLLKFNEDGLVIGEIVNVSVDERVMDESGKVDPEKLQPVTFDPVHTAYRILGKKIGNAFKDGAIIGK